MGPACTFPKGRRRGFGEDVHRVVSLTSSQTPDGAPVKDCAQCAPLSSDPETRIPGTFSKRVADSLPEKQPGQGGVSPKRSGPTTLRQSQAVEVAVFVRQFDRANHTWKKQCSPFLPNFARPSWHGVRCLDVQGMYPGVELRLLRYAVVVSEELHFRRAAERLHLSQPSLSKQILQLEDFLGFKLFDRTKQSVAITPAGHRFVAEARKALLYSHRAVEAGKRADEEPEPLLIGYCSYVNLRVLSTLRRMKPVAETIYRSSSNTEIVSKLLDHEWQVGLVLLPISEPALALRPVSSEPLAVALPSSHSSAKQSKIRLIDLATERWILPQERANPQLHDLLTTHLQLSGVMLATTEEVVTPHDALHLVSESLGVAIVPSSAAYPHIEGISLVPVMDTSLRMETAMAWNPENMSEALRLYLAAGLETLGSCLRPSLRKPPKSA